MSTCGNTYFEQPVIFMTYFIVYNNTPSNLQPGATSTVTCICIILCTFATSSRTTLIFSVRVVRMFCCTGRSTSSCLSKQILRSVPDVCYDLWWTNLGKAPLCNGRPSTAGTGKIGVGRNQAMNGRMCPGATLRILLRLQLHPQRGILHPQSLVCTPNVFTLQGWQ